MEASPQIKIIQYPAMKALFWFKAGLEIFRQKPINWIIGSILYSTVSILLETQFKLDPTSDLVRSVIAFGISVVLFFIFPLILEWMDRSAQTTQEKIPQSQSPLIVLQKTLLLMGSTCGVVLIFGAGIVPMTQIWIHEMIPIFRLFLVTAFIALTIGLFLASYMIFFALILRLKHSITNIKALSLGFKGVISNIAPLVIVLTGLGVVTLFLNLPRIYLIANSPSFELSQHSPYILYLLPIVIVLNAVQITVALCLSYCMYRGIFEDLNHLAPSLKN